MEKSRDKSKTEAIIVIFNELRHRINVFGISESFQFLDERIMIKLQEIVKMFFPEFGGRARADEVVQIDRRSTSLDELQVEKFHFCRSKIWI